MNNLLKLVLENIILDVKVILINRSLIYSEEDTNTKYKQQIPWYMENHHKLNTKMKGHNVILCSSKKQFGKDSKISAFKNWAREKQRGNMKQKVKDQNSSWRCGTGKKRQKTKTQMEIRNCERTISEKDGVIRAVCKKERQIKRLFRAWRTKDANLTRIIFKSVWK